GLVVRDRPRERGRDRPQAPDISLRLKVFVQHGGVSSRARARAVVPLQPRPVGAAGDVAPPVLVIEIPADGLLKPVLETDAAALAELACKLVGIDGVAIIVARPVGDIADQLTAGLPGRRGARRETRGERRLRGETAVNDVADVAHDVAIVALVAAADIVSLA